MQTRGFCYIHFTNEEGAQKAMEMSGQSLMGRSISINEVRDKRLNNE